PRHRGVLGRADAFRRRVRADRSAGDGDQRRLDAGPARPRHLPRPLASPVPRRRRRHATPLTVVVKFGTSLIAGAGGRVRRSLVRARAGEIGALVKGGEPVCLVSSGAIALGLPRLGLDRRPRSVPKLQAASALGQGRLQALWDAELGRAGVRAAQILLTAADVADRTAYVNARNALLALFRLGAVPVVNENDATATEEIAFGDNDALAAQVAILVRARLLVLLTEVEGVYSRAPGEPGAALLEEWQGDALFGPGTALGRGGMRSKVIAAEMAAAAGIPTVVA